MIKMQTVKIIISSDTLNYQGEASITKAAQVIAFLSAEESEVVSAPFATERAPQEYALLERTPKISPRQMLTDSEAKSNSEKIAVFAYYLKTQQGKETAAIQEMRTLFAKAGEPVPKNFSRDLKEAVRANFIFEVSDGEYELTEFGIESIEKKFLHEKVRKTARRTTKVKSTGVVRDEVKALNIGAVEEGLPAFHSLNKGQQILWVMVVADKKGVEELSTAEIVFWIDRLKGNVTSKSFTALNGSNIKNGHLKVTSGGFKVAQIGIDFLKKMGGED
jgi:hypothetical protein